MGIKNRKYKNLPLIHHSDRGLQYCSNDYQILLNKNNIKSSMTESYDPYANAIAERVNRIIKGEFNLEKYAYCHSILKELIEESVVFIISLDLTILALCKHLDKCINNQQ